MDRRCRRLDLDNPKTRHGRPGATGTRPGRTKDVRGNPYEVLWGLYGEWKSTYTSIRHPHSKTSTLSVTYKSNRHLETNKPTSTLLSIQQIVICTTYNHHNDLKSHPRTRYHSSRLERPVRCYRRLEQKASFQPFDVRTLYSTSTLTRTEQSNG